MLQHFQFHYVSLELTNKFEEGNTYSLMRKKPDSTRFKKFISKKFRKWFYFFTCILPDYVPHESQK